jgi:hypothetical protein
MTKKQKLPKTKAIAGKIQTKYPPKKAGLRDTPYRREESKLLTSKKK